MKRRGNDDISAADAKFEAQKIAFAPLAFQAVRAMIETGLLAAVSRAGDAGITREGAAEKAGISAYAAGVLLEMALGLRAVGRRVLPEGEAKEEAEKERFVLKKIGWFLLEDRMTVVNCRFVNDVCYLGAFYLPQSLKNGTPQGLRVFEGRNKNHKNHKNQWKTIYEALPDLPEPAKQSWFGFDHFYSDSAFSAALPLVFARKPRTLFDLGGNTAKWAVRCCKYDPQVRVTIIDLPGQTALAQENARAAGFAERISVYPWDALDPSLPFPAGAGALWMSQFLDCFSLEEITRILARAACALSPEADVFVLEPLVDAQRFEASSYSLRAVSLYFSCMANGNSRMYRFDELTRAVCRGGFTLHEARHDLGPYSHSLLRFRKSP
jgi:hypothetical protein